MLKDWSKKATFSVSNPNTSTLTDYQKLIYLYQNASVTTPVAGKAVTTYGDVKQVITVPDPFGGNTPVAYFDGNGDLLGISNSQCSDFQFGSNNFTIECWVYVPSLTTFGLLWNFARTGVYEGYNCYFDTDGSVKTSITTNGTSWNVFPTKSLGTTGYHHIAVVRDGSSFTVYVDGIGGTSVTNSGSITTSLDNFAIAGSSTHSLSSNCYVSEFRVSNIARYTGTFTPSNKPFTPDPYTKLLLHCDGPVGSNVFIDSSGSGDNIYLPGVKSDFSDIRFADQSGNLIPYWFRNDMGMHRPSPLDGKAITATGDVKQILPFPGAGLGMFDGTGDYLEVLDWYSSGASNIGSNNFTIEGWIYLSTLPSAINVIIGNYSAIDSSNEHVIYISALNTLVWYAYQSGSYLWNIGSGTLNTGWTHFACVRSGSVQIMYINGIPIGTTGSSSSSVNTHTSALKIGSWYGNQAFNGNLSEIRWSNVARYTGPFTPPRTQFQSDSNTKLLLHFLGSGNSFVDSSPSPKTITAYGDAKQLSSPCGSGMIAFDGTGDYLTIPHSDDFEFGAGDFTIEGWASPTGTSWYDIINRYNRQSGKQVFLIGLNSSGYLNASCYSGVDSTIGSISGSTNVVNTTFHFAYVRSGSTFTLYLNGQSIGTATSSVAIQAGDVNTPVTLGAQHAFSSWYYYTGYIGDIRISKGIARYNNNFVPSTQPFKSDSNTKLLLHFDNYTVPTTFLDDSAGKYECWLKVPQIAPTSSSPVSIYWGNANAKSNSNGDNTFDVFDHFEGSSLTTTKWDAPMGAPAISKSVCTITAGSSAWAYLNSLRSLYPNNRVRMRLKTDRYGSNTAWERFSISPGQGGYFASYEGFSGGASGYSKTGSYTYISAITGWSAGVFHTHEMRYTLGQINALVDGSNLVSSSDAGYALPSPVTFATYNSGHSMYIDWMYIGKYYPLEPSLSTFTPIDNTQTEPTGNHLSLPGA